MSQPTNTAAWLTAEKSPALEVKSAPDPTPEANEIVIQTGAVAINPVDFAIQARGTDLFSFLTYPVIIGMDLSGTVVSTGSSVSRFKPGDRVLAIPDVLSKATGGAFQHYVVAQENGASRIPERMSFEQACVLPACLAVAAVGLFDKGYLGLEYPSVEKKSSGKSVVVWGGSTSVGCNAIQLAAAAGYEVVTTCSPHNFPYVKNLGANFAFDYSSPTAVADILGALKGKECAGAVAIGNIRSEENGTAAAEACLEIVNKAEGKKFVSMAMVYKGAVPEGVEQKFILGGAIKDNELGKIIFEDFLEKALEEGKYKIAPEPLVVGRGLDKIQEAFGVLIKGVSAQKVVVSLP